MSYQNQYAYANYDPSTDTVTMTTNRDSDFMIGRSQRDVTIRQAGGVMARLQATSLPDRELVIQFVKFLAATK